jgi:hypothetical protein
MKMEGFSLPVTYKTGCNRLNHNMLAELAVLFCYCGSPESGGNFYNRTEQNS